MNKFEENFSNFVDACKAMIPVAERDFEFFNKKTTYQMSFHQSSFGRPPPPDHRLGTRHFLNTLRKVVHPRVYGKITLQEFVYAMDDAPSMGELSMVSTGASRRLAVQARELMALEASN